MFKNTAGQAVTLLAVDTATGLEKTGDAGNITPYYQLDDGTVTAISSPSVTEISSTHAKGLYKCSLTQGETNGDKILFSGVSITSGIVVVPVTVYTIPSAFGLVAGAAGGLFIAGTNAATTITTALTTTFTGSLTGSVASVTAGVTLAAGAIQAIWDALTSALTTSGSIGKLLVDRIDTTLSLLATAANLSTLNTTTNTINTNVSTALTNLTTILNRIGAFTGSGLNTILGFLRAIMRSDSAITPSDVGGTYDNTSHSEQAIATAPGVGGVTDWTSGERQQIRQALGVTGSTAASTGTGTVDLIKVKTDLIPANPASTTNITAASGVLLTSAYDPAKTAAQAGDAMALTSGERTTLAGVIWATLTSALTTAGSIGKLLVDNINDTISSRLATTGYTVPPTAAANADAVWDEVLSGHLTAGTTGEALDNSGGAGAGATASAIADAVWNELRADHTIDGSFGEGAETVLSRIGAFTGTSNNNILGFLLAMMRNDIAITPSDVGGDYDNTLHSEQAIAEAGSGDAAKDWTDSERAQIRQALGILGITAATTGTGVLDEVLVNSARLTDGRANSLDALPAINAGVTELVANNTDYTDVTSVADAKMTPAKGIRFLVGRFLNARSQNAEVQVLKNDAGDIIATSSVSNVSGTQQYDQAA